MAHNQSINQQSKCGLKALAEYSPSGILQRCWIASPLTLSRLSPVLTLRDSGPIPRPLPSSGDPLDPLLCLPFPAARCPASHPHQPHNIPKVPFGPGSDKEAHGCGTTPRGLCRCCSTGRWSFKAHARSWAPVAGPPSPLGCVAQPVLEVTEGPPRALQRRTLT